MIVTWVDGRKVIGPDETERARAAMSCSPAQMRVALHRAGLLEDIEAIIQADAEAAIIWEYATRIERKSQLIEALKADNGVRDFSDAEIDTLFKAAMQVQI